MADTIPQSKSSGLTNTVDVRRGNITPATAPVTKKASSWNDIILGVVSENWAELSEAESKGQEPLITSGFGLEVVDKRFLLHKSSQNTFVACKGGVYIFGRDYEYGALAAESHGEALERILNPRMGWKGPMRGWGADNGVYDRTKQDVFKPVDVEERED